MNKENTIPRNPGVNLDLSHVRNQRVNTPAVLRRTEQLIGTRTVKKHHQAAWLIKAIQCLDLTTLSGDDTPDRVQRLCRKAITPVRPDLLQHIGIKKLTVGAVCVYQRMVTRAVRELKDTTIPVAAVSTGFPAGLICHNIKLREIQTSVSLGAKEIDVVISRQHVLNNDWAGLFKEISEFKLACSKAHMKVILATGDLITLENVARASWVSMMAGADFIKTSTGKESTNATLPVSLVMARAIRDYHKLTGHRVGYKPAGGISTAKTALQYLFLVKEELGSEWLTPAFFRFGASSLLTDIERQLEHFVTGHYSSTYRHSMP